MVSKRTNQGSIGILVMTNVGLMYLEQDRKLDWFMNHYFKVEQLLLQTAEEMLTQNPES